MNTSVYDIGLDKKTARALIKRNGIKTEEELIEYYHRHDDDINCFRIDYYITFKKLEEIEKIILEKEKILGIKAKKKESSEKSRWEMVNRLNEINVQRARHCLEGFTDVWCSKYVRTGKIELRCEECPFGKEEGSCSIAYFIKEHNKEVEL